MCRFVCLFVCLVCLVCLFGLCWRFFFKHVILCITIGIQKIYDLKTHHYTHKNQTSTILNMSVFFLHVELKNEINFGWGHGSIWLSLKLGYPELTTFRRDAWTPRAADPY